MEYTVLPIEEVIDLGRGIEDSDYLNRLIEIAKRLNTQGRWSDEGLDIVDRLVNDIGYPAIDILLVLVSLVILERKRPWSMWGIYSAIVNGILGIYCLSRKDKIIVSTGEGTLDIEDIRPICSVDDMGEAMYVIDSNPIHTELYTYPLDIDIYIEVLEYIIDNNILFMNATYLLTRDDVPPRLYLDIYNNNHTRNMIVDMTSIYREMLVLEEILTTMPNRECTMSLTHIPRHGTYYYPDIDIHTTM